MTDKSSILKAFNNHFFEFINDIIELVTENDEIIAAKYFFEQLKRSNPTIILKIWYEYIYSPYKDIIDAGSIDFILEKNYRTDLFNLNNAEEILKSIEKIRDPIRSMNNENKETSMKYIQNLSKLSLIYKSQ